MSGRRVRRVRSTIIASLLAVAALVWAAQPSLAVHDINVFELDGNTAQDAAPPPHDWQSLFDASGSSTLPLGTDGLLGSVFLHDSAKPDSSYFARVDKDTHDITTWRCKTVHNPTPKDDLLNAYAAIFRVPDGAGPRAGHKILYVGSERGSNNGDSFAGFWLLKDATVGCDGSGGTTGFSGQHRLGDILVISNYTNGGGSENVQVYAWNPSAPRNLELLTTGNVCSDALHNDDACAIANTAAFTPPWDQNLQQLDRNEFLEAGVDLTALVERTGPLCFSTFQAETRSSQQKTAQLKDFTGDTFETCVTPSVTTTATPGGTVAPGTPQHDVATVHAVGDLPTPTGTVAFFLCRPDQVTPAGCPTDGSQVGTDVTLGNGSATSIEVNAGTTPNDNAEGKYCWRAEYTPRGASVGVYLPSSETNAEVGGETGECFVVHAVPPTSSTPPPPPTSSTPPPPPTSSTPLPPPGSSTTPPPIAATGAGPIGEELAWAVGLLVLGGALAWAGKKRGYLRRH